jgi:putative oxidoreductase
MRLVYHGVVRQTIGPGDVSLMRNLEATPGWGIVNPGCTRTLEASDPIATMKHLPTLAGAVLGLLFVLSGIVVLFNLVSAPPPPEGSPVALFMGALAPTGYLTFVKVLEVVGGVLVAVPRTRNLGLLILGPIIVNILATHTFLMGGAGLLNPMLIVICLLAAWLLWVERHAFAGLVTRRPSR